MNRRSLVLSLSFLLASCGGTSQGVSSSLSTSESGTSSLSSSMDSTSSSVTESSSSSEEISSSSAPNETKVTSLKQGLAYIDENRNYSLSYTSSTAGKCALSFTESSISFYASRNPSADFSYVSDGEGIYRISFDDDEYVAGEYLLGDDGETITDLWGSGVYKNLLGLGKKFIKNIADDATSYEIKDKTYRLNFLQMAGFSLLDYTKFEYLKVSFLNDALYFDLDVNSIHVQYELSSLGTTVDRVKTFFEEEGGEGPLSLYEELYQLRRLMRGNNFIRAIYSYDIEGYMGYEYFLPNYFFSVVNGYSVNSGAMALENEAMDLNGVYMFYLSTEGELSFIGRPVYEKADIIYYYHYPTLMQLWDNMEYIHPGEPEYAGYEYVDESFYVNNASMVYDFVSNFSIDQNFPTSTYKPLALGIDIHLEDNDEDTTVNFIYYFEYGHEVQFMPIPFFSFGAANIKGLDNAWEYYSTLVPSGNE